MVESDFHQLRTKVSPLRKVGNPLEFPNMQSTVRKISTDRCCFNGEGLRPKGVPFLSGCKSGP